MNRSFAVEAPGVDDIASIHVDQIGYLPGMKKVAILSDPQVGYNSDQSYKPSAQIQLVDAATGSHVMALSKVAYNEGKTDRDSGDKVWQVDFSSFTDPGVYYILDVGAGVRSYEFEIGKDVYTQLLRDALKVMYYQRCGVAKEGAINDIACHLADVACKMHNGKGGAIEGAQVDLSGGWHDAGDFNKYVGYAYPAVMLLLSCYMDNPDFWDSFETGLPRSESENDIPDILDEVKWELDWILKMQKPDGSVRHLVSSPAEGFTYSFAKASEDRTVRLFEDASGQASCVALSMFAYGAYVFDRAGYAVYSATLKKAAVKSWNWARDNPDLLDSTPPNYQAVQVLTGSQGNTYGDASGLAHRFEAASFLHLLTSESEYLEFVKANYDAASRRMTYSYDHALYTHNMLVYAKDPDADPEIKAKLLDGFLQHWSEKNTLGAYRHNKVGYSSWGWNGNRSYDAYHAVLLANLEGATASHIQHSEAVMSGVLNYLHGCNPLGFAYLTQLGEFGGDRYLNQFYHGDRQIANRPPAAYLSGGPNAGYSRSDSPPANQPPLKSYDVTLRAPNSWEYLEGQISYQCKYIALLSSVVAYYSSRSD